MIAVHKQRFGKPSAPIDEIQNERKIGQPGHHHLVDICLDSGQQSHKQQGSRTEKPADIGNPDGRPPQNFPVPLDKQLVEALKAIFPAGDGGVCGDGFFTGSLGSLFHGVHLVDHLGEKFLVDLPIIPERDHTSKAHKAYWDPDEKQDGRSLKRGVQTRRQGGDRPMPAAGLSAARQNFWSLFSLRTLPFFS